ncbi:hypothetical protein ACGF0D_26155 [Kitasatospora sp. NPDC048298]|uniref:hypothetical protein n=1 Tax=Kitasatospora sp. NPDC048298 TaxID=3364049 RepID=UPI0037223EAE
MPEPEFAPGADGIAGADSSRPRTGTPVSAVTTVVAAGRRARTTAAVTVPPSAAPASTSCG